MQEAFVLQIKTRTIIKFTVISALTLATMKAIAIKLTPVVKEMSRQMDEANGVQSS